MKTVVRQLTFQPNGKHFLSNLLKLKLSSRHLIIEAGTQGKVPALTGQRARQPNFDTAQKVTRQSMSA
jgi:hypothetical protein